MKGSMMGKYDHLIGKGVENGCFTWVSDGILLYAAGVGAGLAERPGVFKPVFPGDRLDALIWHTDGGAVFQIWANDERLVMDRGFFASVRPRRRAAWVEMQQ
jgi:hypothetical protein